MKSSAWDNKLWHDKMQELPLGEDQDAAWGNMQGLLDESMPVTQGSGVVRKLWGLPRSLVLTLLCTAAAAAIVGLCTHYVFKNEWYKQSQKHKEQHIQHGKMRADSGMIDSNNTDSDKIDSAENISPAVGTKADSAITEKQPGKTANNAPDKNPTTNGQKNNTPAGTPPKQQGGLVQSQSLAGGNALAANTKSKGINQANSVSSNGPNNTPTNVVQNGGHQRQRLSSSYSNYNNNAGSSTGQHSGTRYSKYNSNAGSSIGQQNTTSTPLLPSSNQYQTGNQGRALLAGSSLHVNSLLSVNSTGAVSTRYINKLPANTSIFSAGNTGTADANSGSNKTNKAAKDKAADKPVRMRSPHTNKYFNKSGNSNFDLGLEAGMNSSQNSTTAYAGISAAYFIIPKLSIGTGINLFQSRIIKGGYNIKNTPYTTTGDSGKIIEHTQKLLSTTSSQKIFTVDVPITASYKITNWLSVHGGVVVSIPTKTSTITNTLSAVTAPFDTTSAYKKLTGAINSTTIPNKTTVNLTGGISLNINRIYITGGIVQGLNPYTISTSYGKSSTSYHALQFGIGYKLFKANPKPVHN